MILDLLYLLDISWQVPKIQIEERTIKVPKAWPILNKLTFRELFSFQNDISDIWVGAEVLSMSMSGKLSNI